MHGLSQRLIGAASTASTAEDRRPTTSIPRIAEIAGIQVGYSSMEELEKRIGKGKEITGGHPSGAGLWRVKGTSWMIYADAFDYATNGAVVDTFCITWDDKSERDVPYARIAKKKLAYFGGISLGMVENELLKTVKRNSWKATRNPNGWLIKANGDSPLTSIPSTLKEWTVQFVIRKKAISQIVLAANEEATTK